ncbi:hypothetical protein DVH05_004586 [Phytophthora capsici]|nr:hypothetical protein DVH05_004586 [Phytophthora capsici]
MPTLPDYQVEGITRFLMNSEVSFRYVISLKSGQVNIWLENRYTKKQWQTGLLNKENYVTTANAFVDASAADYVSDEDVERTLMPQLGGEMKLDFSLKIRLLRSSRTIHYTFMLKPIAVERIDILESKLKDVQEELERQRGGYCKEGMAAFLFVECDEWMDSKLMWKEVTAKAFAINEDKTSIKILVPGVYSIGLVVNHVPMTREGLISLQVNEKTIQSAATGQCYSKKYCKQCSSLMSVVQVEEVADLSVLCTSSSATPNLPSYLTVARINH